MRRLRWMCRRGMKELDILLESYLAHNESALRAGAWPELEELLSCEDDLLWDWLRDATAPDDEAFAPLVASIRDATRRGP